MLSLGSWNSVRSFGSPVSDGTAVSGVVSGRRDWTTRRCSARPGAPRNRTAAGAPRAAGRWRPGSRRRRRTSSSPGSDPTGRAGPSPLLVRAGRIARPGRVTARHPARSRGRAGADPSRWSRARQPNMRPLRPGALELVEARARTSTSTTAVPQPPGRLPGRRRGHHRPEEPDAVDRDHRRADLVADQGDRLGVRGTQCVVERLGRGGVGERRRQPDLGERLGTDLVVVLPPPGWISVPIAS